MLTFINGRKSSGESSMTVLQNTEQLLIILNSSGSALDKRYTFIEGFLSVVERTAVDLFGSLVYLI